MYSQTFFVTSVRGKVLAPQIADKASLSCFFAKMPLPAFFMASAFFFPAALVIVVFFVVVVGTVVFVVVVVIAIEGRECTH